MTHMKAEWECEEWRPVIGFEGIYIVSDAGRVMRVKPDKNTRPGLVLKLTETSKGYMRVSLCWDHKRKSAEVHRLVASAFLEKPPECNQVNHINGVTNDNRLANLEWCTARQNMDHSIWVLGNTSRGELNGRAILDSSDVREARRLIAAGMIRADVARFFGVSWSTINCIYNFSHWRDVA